MTRTGRPSTSMRMSPRRAMLPCRPSRASLAARSRNSCGAKHDHAVRLDRGRVGDDAAVDPGVAPLVEGEVAHLLDGRRCHLVHGGVEEFVARVHAHHRLLVLIVDVLVDRPQPAAGLDRAVAKQVVGLGKDLRLLRQVRPLAGEERGVLGQDAELGGQPDDLVDELTARRARDRLRFERDNPGRSALFADLVDQQADLAACPEARDEPVAGRRPVDRKAELEHPGRPPVVAPEGEFERIFPAVLAEQHDLVSFEYVGDSARDQLPRARGSPGSPDEIFGSARTGPSSRLKTAATFTSTSSGAARTSWSRGSHKRSFREEACSRRRPPRT